MIDLQKQPGQAEPTEEEIQQFVNSVYEYAIEKHMEDKKSLAQVKQLLICRGLDAEAADTVSENIREMKRKYAKKDMLYGLLWLAGGLLLTALASARVLFGGAIVWGGFQFLRGLWRYATA